MWEEYYTFTIDLQFGKTVNRFPYFIQQKKKNKISNDINTYVLETANMM